MPVLKYGRRHQAVMRELTGAWRHQRAIGVAHVKRKRIPEVWAHKRSLH